MEKIDRRTFLQLTAAATAGFGFAPFKANSLPASKAKMGIVVHSYAFRWNSKIQSTKYPSFTTAIDLLNHAAELGAGGIQVMVDGWDVDFAKKVRDRREKLGLYLEGSIGMPNTKEEVAGFQQKVINAKEAGATVLRTVTSSGRRYEAYHSNEEVEEFKRKALDSLRWVAPILEVHNVKLAVENHKDWTASELASAMKMISSEHIGVTLDFGNSIALMEQPMDVVNKLVPYVLSTHVKDMAVEEYDDGFLLSEVPLGKGFIDLKKIFELCKKQNPNVQFNLEMITRDPLQIPSNTNEYWASVPLQMDGMIDKNLIKEYQKKQLVKPPRVSQLDDEGKLAIEEKNIIECIDYSKKTLGK